MPSPDASRKTASGRAPSSGGSKTAAVLAPLASELERYDRRHLMPMVVRSGSLLHREGEASSYPGGTGSVRQGISVRWRFVGPHLSVDCRAAKDPDGDGG